MKYENRVCTLEQAIMLKELGINQLNALFYWITSSPAPGILAARCIHSDEYYEYHTGSYGLAALDASELGVMLPHECSFPRPAFDGNWITLKKVFETHPTEAQARAALLIWGIENKLPGFSIDEINKRLAI